jgi:hypothetical protein
VSREIARGWATVDTERAVRELTGLLRTGSAFESAPRSAVLGARCLLAPAATAPSWIVVLEPDTEGRVAAFLARHGEGWAATWLDEAEESADPPARPKGGPGPLGPETLERGGPRWGPYRLRVSAATIEP